MSYINNSVEIPNFITKFAVLELKRNTVIIHFYIIKYEQ